MKINATYLELRIIQASVAIETIHCLISNCFANIKSCMTFHDLSSFFRSSGIYDFFNACVIFIQDEAFLSIKNHQLRSYG